MVTQRTSAETGIYKRATITASGEDVPKAIKHLERKVRRQNENWLADAVRLAKDTLTSPTATEPAKYDAEESLLILDLLRRAYREGRWLDALCEAYWLGRFTEALTVRPQEPHAMRGRKTLAAAKKAGQKTNAKARSRRVNYQREVNENISKDPTLSFERACEFVAKRNSCCTRTVKRYAKNPKKS